MLDQLESAADISANRQPKTIQNSLLTSNDLQSNSSLITPESLGSRSFCKDYGIKYAYLAGAMYKGIASKELIVAMGKSKLMSFLGTGGLTLEEIDSSINFIQSRLDQGQPFGLNLLAGEEVLENRTVDLYLERGIGCIEAAAYMGITPALVRYRLTGLSRNSAGDIEIPHRVLAKVSRPEVAEAFMSPAPAMIVENLVQERSVSVEEAELAQSIPISHDICVEADSGGHTDQGVAYAIVPAIRSLRDRVMEERKYSRPIRVGAAGGIGTPEAAAAAFILGADFILTGSINQCTVEAGTSDAVKSLLQDINVQDTGYAPAGDMFEMGAKIQVLKKGVLFATRANKLFQLYSNHNSLEDIDERIRKQIQEKYFKRSFEDVWSETKAYYSKDSVSIISAIEANPKKKMALMFRWYFVHTNRLALEGSATQKVDYQVHTGPALGAFNQYVKGTNLEDWRSRHVDEIAEIIMRGAAQILTSRFRAFQCNME